MTDIIKKWFGGSKPEKSHFEDDPAGVPCRHPGHNPPNMLYIPPGQVYVHVCPGCGQTCRMRGSSVTL